MKLWKEINSEDGKEKYSAELIEEYRKQSDVIWGNTYHLLQESYTRKLQNTYNKDDDNDEPDLDEK